MTTFAVMLSVLQKACDTWDDQAEQLRGGHKRLTDAQTSVTKLGDRVGPVATTYLATWLTEITNQATAAQSRSDSLAEIGKSVVELDAAAADDLKSYLPWSSQAAIEYCPSGRPSFPTDDPGPAPPDPYGSDG